MFVNYNGVFGLSGSGFDVEGTVEKLMQTERSKYDKMYQQKEKLTWQKDAYREQNTALTTFRNKVFDLKLKANLDLRKSTTSNESAVSVTAGSTAVNGTNSINVKQLAEGVAIGSSEGLGSVLKDGKFDFGEGVESKQFELNGKTITVKNGSSISSLVSTINSAGLGVKASYDSTLDRFFLSTNKTGESAEIKLKDKDGFFKDCLKITKDQNGNSIDYTQESLTFNGKSAIFDLNGVENLKQESNKFTISGLTYNLKSANTGPVTVTTSADTEAIYNQIKDFMDSYNTLIADIYTKINETSYRDYPPLTEQQEEEMTEEEIKKWNKKAQSGLLKNDTTLSSLLSTMRVEMSSVLKIINSNNDSVVTASAGSKARLGETTVNVIKVATGASVEGLVIKQDLFAKDGDTEKIVGRGKTFTINDKTFTLADNETVDSLSQKIAKELNCNVTLADGKMKITTINTGVNAALKFEADCSNVFSGGVPEGIVKNGENAEVEINGVEKKSESNTLEYEGITYNFQSIGETTVSVTGSKLVDFGIETGTYDTHGKLVFSDNTGDALKQAIENDPDAVINFFTKQSKTNDAEKGLAQRLQETLDKAISELKDKAGSTAKYSDQSTIGKQIGKLETNLADELKRLKEIEENYYSKYSQMEVYINQMLQQSNMFSTYAGTSSY